MMSSAVWFELCSSRPCLDVEQHTAQKEDLEALAKRSFAARSLYHLGESMRQSPLLTPLSA
jgi:hypothetical protein